MNQLHTTRFYHFTSWLPERTDVGEPLVTSFSESQYWQQKRLDLKPLEKISNGISGATKKLVENLTKNLRADDPRELEGTINAIAAVIEYGKRGTEILKEFIFEQVRCNNYKYRPSRFRCMYMFDTDINPGEYRERLNIQKEYRSRLVELEVLGGTVHRASLSTLDCTGRGYGGLLEAAHRYWTHVEEPSLDTEVLFVGSFRVLRFIEEL